MNKTLINSLKINNHINSSIIPVLLKYRGKLYTSILEDNKVSDLQFIDDRYLTDYLVEHFDAARAFLSMFKTQITLQDGKPIKLTANTVQIAYHDNENVYNTLIYDI